MVFIPFDGPEGPGPAQYRGTSERRTNDVFAFSSFMWSRWAKTKERGSVTVIALLLVSIVCYWHRTTSPITMGDSQRISIHRLLGQGLGSLPFWFRSISSILYTQLQLMVQSDSRKYRSWFFFSFYLIMCVSCRCGVVEELAWSGGATRIVFDVVVPVRASRVQFLVFRRQCLLASRPHSLFLGESC